MSQQLPQGMSRQGLDATCEADEAREAAAAELARRREALAWLKGACLTAVTEQITVMA